MSWFSRILPPLIGYRQSTFLKDRVYKPSFCEENTPESFSISNPFLSTSDPSLLLLRLDSIGNGSDRSPPLFSVFQQRLEALAGAAIGGSFDTTQSTTLLHSSLSLGTDRYNPSSFIQRFLLR
ncbi:hypothetical protein MRB53_002084 [Persea americana]|uniref:Uncharacterized protein n=1 Tax=Persea americana TaxID=3435 RepID=A0ACC2MTJ0_PERAE|nr:hypothetical protein MRB53_002084 [Persea americana]